MDNNERLARFMGKGRYNDYEEFNFQSDYNDLMELVERIESKEYKDIGYVDIHIMPDAVIVYKQTDEDNPLILINKSEGMGSLEKVPFYYEDKRVALYQACLIFVKWYYLKKVENENSNQG